MTRRRLKNCFVSVVACLVLAWPAAAAPPIKNIVLVHGAFVDGSGWQPVYDILVQEGYRVTLVQEPLTSLEEDVAAARRILDRQDSPCILVARYVLAALQNRLGEDLIENYLDALNQELVDRMQRGGEASSGAGTKDRLDKKAAEFEAGCWGLNREVFAT